MFLVSKSVLWVKLRKHLRQCHGEAQEFLLLFFIHWLIGVEAMLGLHPLLHPHGRFARAVQVVADSLRLSFVPSCALLQSIVVFQYFACCPLSDLHGILVPLQAIFSGKDFHLLEVLIQD